MALIGHTRLLQILAVLVCALAGGLAPGVAKAAEEVRLDASIGWDRVRPGRWTPIYVTASADKPRKVRFEIVAPVGRGKSMAIREPVTIGPIPTTRLFYAPLVESWDNHLAVAALDDAGRSLAVVKRPEGSLGPEAAPLQLMVGVCGRQSSADFLNNKSLIPCGIATGFVALDRLPGQAIGYAPLDGLVMDRPDLLRLPLEQQRAIVLWIRQGGSLLLWPNDDPAPRDGPLVEALPCLIGGARTATLSAKQLDRLGLSPRAARLGGRHLTPNPSAGQSEAVPLFGDDGDRGDLAYRCRLGLGRILVTPVSLADLEFRDDAHASSALGPLLSDAALSCRTADDTASSFGGGERFDPEITRQLQCVTVLADHLADVPGAGTFGFGFVAAAMLGLMLVVGPIDWFVLRRLRRQPLTWVTTTAWIALVTGGAVYAGQVIKSGDLYFRSFAVVDQAGGAVVGQSSLSAIYSPRTADYHLDPTPGTLAGSIPSNDAAGWWRPTLLDSAPMDQSASDEIDFHQDGAGCVSGPLRVNIWDFAFFSADRALAGPALIDADLTTDEGRVWGAVKNLTDRPITEIHVRTSKGTTVATIGPIEPHGAASIDAPLVGGDFTPANPDNQQMGALPLSSFGAGGIPYWRYAAGQAGSRSGAIERALADGNSACVYAIWSDAPPPANLREPGAIQSHTTVIRAVVPLSKHVRPPTPGPTTGPLGGKGN